MLMKTAGQLLGDAFILGSFGMGIEVLLDALTNGLENWKTDKNLRGRSSLYYGFAYALWAPVFTYGWPVLMSLGLLRFPLYVLVLFCGEHTVNWLIFQCTGDHPSRKTYQNSKWGGGRFKTVSWNYFFVWAPAGILLEGVFKYIHKLPPFTA